MVFLRNANTSLQILSSVMPNIALLLIIKLYDTNTTMTMNLDQIEERVVLLQKVLCTKTSYHKLFASFQNCVSDCMRVIKTAL